MKHNKEGKEGHRIVRGFLQYLTKNTLKLTLKINKSKIKKEEVKKQQ